VLRSYQQVLWRGRRWLATAVLLFVLGAVAGYVLAVANPGTVMETIRPLLSLLRGMGERIAASESPVERTLIIFRNNLLAVVRMMVGGVLLGILPAMATAGNGLLLGMVFGLGSRLSPLGASPWVMLLSVVPHAIFEVPALWIAGAWGMKLGLAWLLPSAAGGRLQVLRQSAAEAVQMGVLAIVLLLVAAAVEGNITLYLVRGGRLPG
jgi:stage II sporulation protein M